MANVYDQNKTQHYVSLLNFDDTVDDATTFRYACAVSNHKVPGLEAIFYAEHKLLIKFIKS